MNDQITLTILAQDDGGGAGLLNLTGSSVFNDQPSDFSYVSGYNLIYTINQGESGTQITFSVFDRVGNVNSSVILDLDIDNDAPTEPAIIGIIESSNNLYYNGVTLYYSNNQVMTDSFTIEVITSDSGAGLLQANGSTDFGVTPVDMVEDAGQYDLIYIVSQGDFASGDLVNITVLDLVGNVNSTSLSCVLDNNAPTKPVITQISESSEFLHFNDPTFFYSNDQPMSESFTIQFTTIDPSSGLLKATGSIDFGGESPEDTSYSGQYELTYTVSSGETSGVDNYINITVLDQVGNSELYSLNCVLDNTGPTSISINNVIVELGAQFLFYDSSGETFYYSNDQSMSESFTVQVTAIDSLSGRLKANASEFGDSISNNTYGGSGFELTFTVNQGETSPSFNIEAWDNVGNPTSIALTTNLDNTPPQSLTISAVLESSDFLYYDGSALYFSNDQSMTTTFRIRVSGTESGSGRKNATGEVEFGDTNVGNTTYTTYYELQYIVEQDDDVSDGAVTIWLYDKVGNRNSININCRKDNTAPRLDIDFPFDRVWNNTLGGVISYGGTAIDDQGTYNSGITQNSFAFSQYDEVALAYIDNNISFSVDSLVGSNWIEENDISTILNSNITLTIYCRDRVNNTNLYSIQIWHDDTAPEIKYNTPSAGGITQYYKLADNQTSFDIDFLRNNESHSLASRIVKAEYRTDDGQGWYVIFDQAQVANYTTDWLIADWDLTLFNGENTIDIRVWDNAGNNRTHVYSNGIAGFNLRIDTQGPTIYSIEVFGDEPGIPNPSLFDWNGTDFLLSFVFNSSSEIDYIYIKSDLNNIE
ncbi:MAG: hypothetical protein ACW99Q_23365, partial [Candidatus Kariarchaeaceae archaeon]